MSPWAEVEAKTASGESDPRVWDITEVTELPNYTQPIDVVVLYRHRAWPVFGPVQEEAKVCITGEDTAVVTVRSRQSRAPQTIFIGHLDEHRPKIKSHAGQDPEASLEKWHIERLQVYGQDFWIKIGNGKARGVIYINNNGQHQPLENSGTKTLD